jgi:TPR repeat protein
LTLFALTSAAQEPKPPQLPTNLEESFVALENLLKPEDLAAIKSGTEDDLIQYHFGLGMWMRNSWDLWAGGPLAKYFENLGLHHPDDMSGLILTAFWRHLNGRPLELDAEVAHYQAFWFEAAKSECDNVELFGQADACARLGYFYQVGEGTDRDMDRAMQLYNRACRDGSASGCFSLADALLGDRSQGNKGRARTLKKRGLALLVEACQDDDGEACFNAARAYETGQAGKRDLERARQYYSQACKYPLPDPEACEALKRFEK